MPDSPRMNVLTAVDLTLEPQIAAHAEPMFEVLGDPALYEFENEPPSSLAWLRDRFLKLESRRSPDGAELWLNWVVRLVALRSMDRSCILMHMRTTLNIDDELLRRAHVLTGVQEKTALVRRGLEALIALESARRLAALGGSQKGLKLSPRRRTGRA